MQSLSSWSPDPKIQTTLSMGVFDGVHLGHQALLAETIRLAKELANTSLVLTFDPHPAVCLAPDNAPKLLMTPREREVKLRKSGLNEVLFANFDASFAALSAEQFATEILQKHLGAQAIVIGEDFRFGKGRTGDAALLEAKGFRVHTVPSVLIDGIPARSTVIRQALLEGNLVEGNLALANTLLGTPYTLSGKVVKGKQLGRTIGFPTANLHTDPRVLVPAPGVYAGVTTVDNRTYPIAISVGVNQTIGDNLPSTTEAYLLDFEGDLYGQTLCFSFVKYLRPMVKFEGLESLKKQIAEDVMQVRQASF